MHRQKRILYSTKNGDLRTVIKTKHGRIICLELTRSNRMLFVKDCYYLDRIRYYATPQKLKTLSFQYSETLDVIATELDRRFYGIEVVYSDIDYDTEKFIHKKLCEMQRGYKFLIFVGEGLTINGLP